MIYTTLDPGREGKRREGENSRGRKKGLEMRQCLEPLVFLKKEDTVLMTIYEPPPLKNHTAA